MKYRTDIEKLRKDMADNFGTAVTNGFGMAVTELVRVNSASEQELLNIAKEQNIDLSGYRKPRF